MNQSLYLIVVATWTFLTAYVSCMDSSRDDGSHCIDGKVNICIEENDCDWRAIRLYARPLASTLPFLYISENFELAFAQCSCCPYKDHFQHVSSLEILLLKEHYVVGLGDDFDSLQMVKYQDAVVMPKNSGLDHFVITHALGSLKSCLTCAGVLITVGPNATTYQLLGLNNAPIVIGLDFDASDSHDQLKSTLERLAIEPGLIIDEDAERLVEFPIGPVKGPIKFDFWAHDIGIPDHDVIMSCGEHVVTMLNFPTLFLRGPSIRVGSYNSVQQDPPNEESYNFDFFYPTTSLQSFAYLYDTIIAGSLQRVLNIKVHSIYFDGITNNRKRSIKIQFNRRISFEDALVLYRYLDGNLGGYINKLDARCGDSICMGGERCPNASVVSFTIGAELPFFLRHAKAMNISGAGLIFYDPPIRIGDENNVSSIKKRVKMHMKHNRNVKSMMLGRFMSQEINPTIITTSFALGEASDVIAELAELIMFDSSNNNALSPFIESVFFIAYSEKEALVGVVVKLLSLVPIDSICQTLNTIKLSVKPLRSFFVDTMKSCSVSGHGYFMVGDARKKEVPTSKKVTTKDIKKVAQALPKSPQSKDLIEKPATKIDEKNPTKSITKTEVIKPVNSESEMKDIKKATEALPKPPQSKDQIEKLATKIDEKRPTKAITTTEQMKPDNHKPLQSSTISLEESKNKIQVKPEAPKQISHISSEKSVASTQMVTTVETEVCTKGTNLSVALANELPGEIKNDEQIVRRAKMLSDLWELTSLPIKYISLYVKAGDGKPTVLLTDDVRVGLFGKFKCLDFPKEIRDGTAAPGHVITLFATPSKSYGTLDLYDIDEADFELQFQEEMWFKPNDILSTIEKLLDQVSDINFIRLTFKKLTVIIQIYDFAPNYPEKLKATEGYMSAISAEHPYVNLRLPRISTSQEYYTVSPWLRSSVIWYNMVNADINAQPCKKFVLRFFGNNKEKDADDLLAISFEQETHDIRNILCSVRMFESTQVPGSLTLELETAQNAERLYLRSSVPRNGSRQASMIVRGLPMPSGTNKRKSPLADFSILHDDFPIFVIGSSSIPIRTFNDMRREFLAFKGTKNTMLKITRFSFAGNAEMHGSKSFSCILNEAQILHRLPLLAASLLNSDHADDFVDLWVFCLHSIDIAPVKNDGKSKGRKNQGTPKWKFTFNFLKHHVNQVNFDLINKELYNIMTQGLPSSRNTRSSAETNTAKVEPKKELSVAQKTNNVRADISAIVTKAQLLDAKIRGSVQSKDQLDIVDAEIKSIHQELEDLSGILLALQEKLNNMFAKDSIIISEDKPTIITTISELGSILSQASRNSPWKFYTGAEAMEHLSLKPGTGCQTLQTKIRFESLEHTRTKFMALVKAFAMDEDQALNVLSIECSFELQSEMVCFSISVNIPQGPNFLSTM